MKYLTDMPNICNDYGFNKVLLVRKLAIHHKHIMTDIFVRKKFNIEQMLQKVNIKFYIWMEQNTNYLRRIYKIPRNLVYDVNTIQNIKIREFSKFLELFYANNIPNLTKDQEFLKSKTILVIDFDNVITDAKFQELYSILHNKGIKIIINTANQDITKKWFIKNNLSLPYQIYANNGKIKKIRKLFELSKKYFVFYIDDEKEYLEYGYIFGCFVYQWDKQSKKLKALFSK